MLTAAHLRIAAVLATVAGAFVAGWQVHAWRAGAAHARDVEQQLQDADDQAELGRIQRRDRAATAERIDRETLTKLRAADRARDDVHVAGDGLRVELASGRADARTGANAGECGALRARARVLEDLLDESARLLEEGADIAQRAPAVIEGLQAREHEYLTPKN